MAAVPTHLPDARMSTKEQDFKARFVAVMRDMRDNGLKDPEAVWMIGSLASRLIDLYKLKTWTQFKARLTREAYDQLLKEFQEQGNKYYRDGKDRAAYAVQLLAASVVASTQSDTEVQAGNQLLDQMINGIVLQYGQAVASRTAKTN
jgi:hypothetical protein